MMDATEKMLLESARQGDARSACALLPWLGRFGWRKPNYWPLPCDDGKIKDVGDWDDFVSEIGEHLDYQQAEMVCRLIVLAVERCERGGSAHEARTLLPGREEGGRRMKPLPECPLCGAKCLKTPTGYSFRGGCQFYSVGCQRDTPDLCIYQGIPLPLHRTLCALIAKLRAVGKVQDERKVQRALTRHDQGRAQLLHPERLMRGTGERRAGK